MQPSATVNAAGCAGRCSRLRRPTQPAAFLHMSMYHFTRPYVLAETMLRPKGASPYARQSIDMHKDHPYLIVRFCLACTKIQPSMFREQAYLVRQTGQARSWMTGDSSWMMSHKLPIIHYKLPIALHLCKRFLYNPTIEVKGWRGKRPRNTGKHCIGLLKRYGKNKGSIRKPRWWFV